MRGSAVPARPSQTALQARLDVPLDSRRTATGSPVFASLLYPWSGSDCSLAKGSVISGHVTQVAPRAAGTPGAQVTLTFDRADCNGQHGTPVQFLLYAIVETADNSGSGFHDRSGLFGSISPHPVAHEGPVARVSTDDAVRNGINSDLRGSSQPGAVKAGQVIGESGLALDFSAASQNSVRILAPHRDFRINTGSQLILVPAPHGESSAEPALEHRAALPSPAPVIAAPPRATPVSVDETEICAANCSELAGPVSSPGNSAAGAAVLSASLTHLGYQPTSYRPRSGFDHETTLSFLSNEQLLLTFDPHRLRRRTGETWHAGTQRSVRAVLLDSASLRIQRVLDWQVDADGQYLWKAGPGRVLVHHGGALHLLGSDLHELASLPADGNLRWAVVSPSGNRIALGFEQERHTREAHDTIQRLSGIEPVEDLQMQLLDNTGKILFTSKGDTTDTPPVLTDRSELLVRGLGSARWRLDERSDSGVSTHGITTVTSTCAPRLSAPLTGDIFVLGCDEQGGRWMRLLRENGHTLLKSRASQEETQQTTLGSNQHFVLHLVNLKHASNEDLPRSAEELDSERLQVRRERDGKLLLDLLERQFPPSSDAFALAPDGMHLASMTQTQVEIRTVTEFGTPPQSP